MLATVPFSNPQASPGQPSSGAGSDQVELDPEAFESETPLELDLQEFKDNQGPVTQTVGVAKQADDLVRAGQGAPTDTGAVSAVSRNVGRAAGPLNVAFGAKDAAEGVKQMRDGEVLEGGLKATQGATSSASGLATTVKTWAPLLENATSVSQAAGVAGKVSGPLGA
ncbi:MAG: hypothetical protein AB1758_29845, partial [Candidatus Eremiobacterota bacterium]